MNTNNVYITGEAYGLAQVNSPVITSFQVGDIIYGSNMLTKVRVRERKLEVRRRLDTALVLTINDAS